MIDWLKTTWHHFGLIFDKVPNLASWVIIFLFLLCGAISKFVIRDLDEGIMAFIDTVFLGITAALFTRLLGGMGVFRDAISDMFVSDTWIRRRNDLPKLWSRITKELFIQDYDKFSKGDDSEFSAELDKALSRAIQHPEKKFNYYISQARRKLIVDWHEKDRSIIKITDEYSLNINPFDPTKPCSYDFEIDIDVSKEYRIGAVLLKSIKLGEDELNPQEYIKPAPNDRFSVSIPIDPRKNRRLQRTIEYTFSMNDTPLLFVTSGRFTLGMNVIIARKPNAQDLNFSFIELGMGDLFEPVGADTPELIERMTEVALLPEQGFVLTVLRGLDKSVPVENNPSEAGIPALG